MIEETYAIFDYSCNNHISCSKRPQPKAIKKGAPIGQCDFERCSSLETIET